MALPTSRSDGSSSVLVLPLLVRPASRPAFSGKNGYGCRTEA